MHDNAENCYVYHFRHEADVEDIDLMDEDQKKAEEERLIEERRKRRQEILLKYQAKKAIPSDGDGGIGRWDNIWVISYNNRYWRGFT